MTTDPTPEQLNALAGTMQGIASIFKDDSDDFKALWKAARHLRAYAELIAKPKHNYSKHSGDCHWWSYKVCDCGYLMRANSHDFGDPTSETIEQFLEHSKRIQEPANQLAQRDARIKELEAQLFSAKSSIQICVGAAGLGDPDELCGWIDNAKAQLCEREVESEKLREALGGCVHFLTSWMPVNPLNDWLSERDRVVANAQALRRSKESSDRNPVQQTSPEP